MLGLEDIIDILKRNKGFYVRMFVLGSVIGLMFSVLEWSRKDSMTGKELFEYIESLKKKIEEEEYEALKAFFKRIYPELSHLYDALK